jgi:hypothetical protein
MIVRHLLRWHKQASSIGRHCDGGQKTRRRRGVQAQNQLWKLGFRGGRKDDYTRRRICVGASPETRQTAGYFPAKEVIDLTEESYETRRSGTHRCHGPGLVGDDGRGARTLRLGTATGNRILLQPRGPGAVLLSAACAAGVRLLGAAPTAAAGLCSASGSKHWLVVRIVITNCAMLDCRSIPGDRLPKLASDRLFIAPSGLPQISRFGSASARSRAPESREMPGR